MQEQPDNYYSISNLLNIEESQRAKYETSTKHGAEKNSMEWFDLVNFKEENSYDDDESSPEKDTERKRKHNRSKRIIHKHL